MYRVFRFHCFGIPHVQTIAEESACAYTQKVIKFCKMMKMYYPKHTIIFYGSKRNDVIADEYVPLVDEADFERTYGDYNTRKNFYKFDAHDHINAKFNTLGGQEFTKRAKPGDFALLFWGYGHYGFNEAATKMGGINIVEPGIGYNDSFCNYRVFESYAIMAWAHGKQDTGPNSYFSVIPNYFDLDDFEYNDTKEDYFLCLGRIGNVKGTNVAVEAAIKLGFKLKIAGQGSIKNELGYDTLPDNIEHLGYVGPVERKKLLKNAKGLFIYPCYLEPFGGVVIEALLSGTPVITSDNGVFNETNIHGLTGYRVHTFDHICWAFNNIDKIKPINCRKWAENYSLKNIAPMYQEYFSMVADISVGQGWYTLHPERTELDWLSKEYTFIPAKVDRPIEHDVSMYKPPKIVHHSNLETILVNATAADFNNLTLTPPGFFISDEAHNVMTLYDWEFESKKVKTMSDSEGVDMIKICEEKKIMQCKCMIIASEVDLQFLDTLVDSKRIACLKFKYTHQSELAKYTDKYTIQLNAAGWYTMTRLDEKIQVLEEVPTRFGDYITLSNKWQDVMIVSCMHGHVQHVPLCAYMTMLQHPNACNQC